MVVVSGLSLYLRDESSYICDTSHHDSRSKRTRHFQGEGVRGIPSFCRKATSIFFFCTSSMMGPSLRVVWVSLFHKLLRIGLNFSIDLSFYRCWNTRVILGYLFIRMCSGRFPPWSSHRWRPSRGRWPTEWAPRYGADSSDGGAEHAFLWGL